MRGQLLIAARKVKRKKLEVLLIVVTHKDLSFLEMDAKEKTIVEVRNECVSFSERDIKIKPEQRVLEEVDILNYYVPIKQYSLIDGRVYTEEVQSVSKVGVKGYVFMKLVDSNGAEVEETVWVQEEIERATSNWS